MKTPRWVWWALLVGATVVVVWAVFLFSFLSEPSAVGRPRAALLALSGYSGLAAILAVFVAARLRRTGQSWRLAVAASVAITLTGVGAIVGVPLLIELFLSRRLS
jgi:hypothetical protein